VRPDYHATPRVESVRLPPQLTAQRCTTMPKCQRIQEDVANLADLDPLYETVRKMGRIDIVFANAGFGEFVH
jgi:hypothetical protein